MHILWLHNFKVLITVGAIIFLGACNTVSEPAAVSGSIPSPQTVGDLDEISPGDPSAIDEFAVFCQAISIDTGNSTLPPSDPQAAAAIVAAYRAALNVAPPEIFRELAALLDFLEFGIEPDFGERSENPVLEPSEPLDSGSAADPVTEPTDPFVFISPDADQLALSVAEFLELRCGGVALNPLPPPTTPLAGPSGP